MNRVLIVDDDEGLRKQLKWCFDGFDVETAEDRPGALAAVQRYEPQVVILDLGLPPDPANASEGLHALREIRELSPATKVIVVTGNEDRENALQSVAMGAYDYCQKPVDPDVLKAIVDRALHLYEIELDNRRLQERDFASPLAGVVAGSPEMIRVCQVAERVASTNATILLLGESGTGKELIARAIHDLSDVSEGRFVAINCAAIPENLLESELFGHEKGAFTGATRQNIGKIELAHGGTLFLDEIGDLPLALQAKLLRFLQERVIERIGGREEISVETRILSATHRDLQSMIREGTFREDLYYRLTEVVITIPPLRERKGDAVMLAKAFLERHAAELRRRIKGFTTEAIAAMEEYAWPGNIRELENRVKRAVIMTETPEITPEDLELRESKSPEEAFNLRLVRQAAEERAVRKALAFSDGNVSRASELLGVSRPTLYDLMRKLGVK